MSNQSPILQAKNIVKHFDHNSETMLALDGINLDVHEGDFICLVGPSGCGKSTFLNIIAGLEKPVRIQRRLETLDGLGAVARRQADLR